jgi:hypothetical protein
MLSVCNGNACRANAPAACPDTAFAIGLLKLDGTLCRGGLRLARGAQFVDPKTHWSRAV